jgi:hypothetical protein
VSAFAQRIRRRELKRGVIKKLLLMAIAGVALLGFAVVVTGSLLAKRHVASRKASFNGTSARRILERQLRLHTLEPRDRNTGALRSPMEVGRAADPVVP